MKRIWEKLLCGVMATGAIVCGADLELPGENLGIKKPSDVVEVEAVVKDMRTAGVINRGGWPWSGRMFKGTDKAKFVARVPETFNGKHCSTFGGEFGTVGQSGGKVLTWEKRTVAYSKDAPWVSLQKRQTFTNTSDNWTSSLLAKYGGDWGDDKPAFSLTANFESEKPIYYPQDLSRHIFSQGKEAKIQISKESGAGFLVPPASKERVFTFTIEAKAKTKNNIEIVKTGSVDIVVKNKKPDLTIRSANSDANFAQQTVWPNVSTVDLDTIKFSDLETEDSDNEKDKKNGGMENKPNDNEIADLQDVSSFAFSRVRLSNGGIIKSYKSSSGWSGSPPNADMGGKQSDNFVTVNSKFDESKGSWTVFAVLSNIQNLLVQSDTTRKPNKATKKPDKGKKYYRSVRVTYKLNKIKLKGISDKVNQRVEVDIDNKNQDAKEKWERQFWILGKDVQKEN